MDRKKRIVRIEDWAIADVFGGPAINGKVYGHPRFPEGSQVTTSYVVDKDPKERIIITYSGTNYSLGKARKEYEAMFPNAEERIFGQAKEVPA